MDTGMHLTVLLPFKVLLSVTGVQQVMAETQQGQFGLLPNRLDCVAALIPGILTYQAPGTGEHYIAIDEGILVKTGRQVTVSVRNAVSGATLGHLHEIIEKQFKEIDSAQEEVKLVMAKLESSFIRGFQKIKTT